MPPSCCRVSDAAGAAQNSFVTSPASSGPAHSLKECEARALVPAPAACAALSWGKTAAEFQPAAPTFSAGSSPLAQPTTAAGGHDCGHEVTRKKGGI